MRKRQAIVALVGLAALVVSSVPGAVQAEEPARLAAPPAVTLQLADLPGGRYLGRTLDLGSDEIQAERFDRMEGTGPAIIISVALLGSRLGVDTDGFGFIQDFVGGFESTSELDLRDFDPVDGSAFGPQALMASFRVQPAASSAAAADVTLPTAGYGALIIFGEGPIVSFLMVLDGEGPAADALSNYAAVVDARVAAALAS
jgi:hypothetical protein